MGPPALFFTVRLCLLPQELLEHGVCDEVERVRLSERYQTMKVHRAALSKGPQLHGVPSEPQQGYHHVRQQEGVAGPTLGFPKLPGPGMDAALVKRYFFRVQVSVWGLSSPFSSTEHPGERLPGLLHGP